MEKDDERLRISQECRQILSKPCYSTQVTAKLIGWLYHPNAAVSDIAGRCLITFGAPAFEDLLANVTASNALPCPNAVWVLSEISPCSDRLLRLLRSWLFESSGKLERQCALSLAHSIVALKRKGYPPNPEGVLACTRTMELHLSDGPSMRLQHHEFMAGLRTGPVA